MARKLEINRIGRSLKTKNKDIKLNCKHTQNIENYIYTRDVNVLIFLDFSFRYDSVHQNY